MPWNAEGLALNPRFDSKPMSHSWARWSGRTQGRISNHLYLYSRRFPHKTATHLMTSQMSSQMSSVDEVALH